jgi:hypothetical protein
MLPVNALIVDENFDVLPSRWSSTGDPEKRLLISQAGANAKGHIPLLTTPARASRGDYIELVWSGH